MFRKVKQTLKVYHQNIVINNSYNKQLLGVLIKIQYDLYFKLLKYIYLLAAKKS